MRLDAFDFEVPPERIAQHPVTPRDAARLLDLTGGGLADRQMLDLPSRLAPGDLMIVNDTKVLPTRLTGRRREAKIEVTLVKALSDSEWQAFARPARKLTAGDEIRFAETLGATVIEKRDGGEIDLRFDLSGVALRDALVEYGAMPLPPYIARRQGPEAEDRERYQTVFARQEGAVAAPTAGLHFTERLLAALADRGVGLKRVTLHVGAGTFLPIRAEVIEEHRMHAEWCCIDAGTVAAIEETKRAGGRVLAIGTTAMRTLESAARDGRLKPFSGETDLFITPGFRFNVVDLLLTNFHLPKSTLFILVSAFAGLERMRSAYAHAIEAGYRFYSYGDASLLEREPS